MKRWVHSSSRPTVWDDYSNEYQPKSEYCVYYVTGDGVHMATYVTAIDYEDAKKVFYDQVKNFENKPIRRIIDIQRV